MPVLSDRESINALIYGVLLGIVCSTIVFFFIFTNVKIQHQKDIEFVTSVQLVQYNDKE